MSRAARLGQTTAAKKLCGGNPSGSAQASSSANSAAVCLAGDGSFAIKIHAKPGAKESSISNIDSDCIHVQIGAPPKDDEANAELLSFLGSALGIRKSQISLEKGQKSKGKVVQVSRECFASAEDVLKKLKSAAKVD